MKIKNPLAQYVIDNYYDLPKSSFNGKKLVIVKEYTNENEGWGNHSYSGIGVDKKGSFYYCYSSGCSCSGTCGMDNIEAHKKSGKVLNLPEESNNLPTEIPSIEEFNNMVVSFSDYS